MGFGGNGGIFEAARIGSYTRIDTSCQLFIHFYAQRLYKLIDSLTAGCCIGL